MQRRSLLAGAIAMTLEGKPAPTALVADAVYQEHVTGVGHPERPERYEAVASAINKAGLESAVLRVVQRPATEDENFLFIGWA